MVCGMMITHRKRVWYRVTNWGQFNEFIQKPDNIQRASTRHVPLHRRLSAPDFTLIND